MSEDIIKLRKENFKEPLALSELERRWRAVRAAMAKENLDCLVMQSHDQHLGGYVPYFTDLVTSNSYTATVIFPLNDEMTMISHGAPGVNVNPPAYARPGIKENISSPYFHTFNFSDTWAAEIAVNTFKKLKIKSLGFVSPAVMSATFSDYLKDNLPGVEIRNATDLVDEIKAVKSEEELRLIRGTVAMQDKVWGDTLALIHPGMRGYELRAEIQRLLTYLGSEEQLLSINSGPATTAVRHAGIRFQNRMFQKGDAVFLMIEVNGPGGLYGELGRTVVIGDDIPKPLQTVWDYAVELQDRTAEAMKPGSDPKELFAMHNKLLTAKGYPPEARLYAHGQGYDLVERPGIVAEETMKIKANMNITIHPFVVLPNAFAFCCDNFFVTESGAVRIHKTPREVFVV